MKRNPVILVSLLFLIPVSLKAQGPIVAVFDMEDKGSGLAPELLGKLSDYLGAEFCD